MHCTLNFNGHWVNFLVLCKSTVESNRCVGNMFIQIMKYKLNILVATGANGSVANLLHFHKWGHSFEGIVALHGIIFLRLPTTLLQHWKFGSWILISYDYGSEITWQIAALAFYTCIKYMKMLHLSFWQWTLKWHLTKLRIDYIK